MSLLEFLEKKSSDVKIPDGEPARILESFTRTLPLPELPISAESSNWLTAKDPERLVRTFNFERFEHLDYFVNEVLRYQEHVQHHASIIIEHRSVTVETFTHDIEAVTQQDLKLADHIDEVYGDVRLLNIGGEEE